MNISERKLAFSYPGIPIVSVLMFFFYIFIHVFFVITQDRSYKRRRLVKNKAIAPIAVFVDSRV